MVEHAVRWWPLEACGLISERDGRPCRFFATTNVAGSETRFEIAPEELFAVRRAIRTAGESLWGIFHSHPNGVAYPSRLDRERACQAGVLHIILSLADLAAPSLRAFRLGEGPVRECRVVIEH